MPRILRIINRFNLGGPTYNAAYLTKYLPEDFETLLVGGTKDETEDSSEFILENLGLTAHIIPEMRRKINPQLDYIAYKKLKALIADFKPDIVHTHASKPGALGRMAAHNMKVPVIVHTYHGHVFHSYFGNATTLFYKNMERKLAGISTKIIAISDKQKVELCEEHRICTADKIEVIPLGFDLNRFNENVDNNRSAMRMEYNIRPEQIAIAIIGRLVPIKNHGLFLRAIKEVKARTKYSIRAFVVGDGEMRDDLEAYCSELGLTYSSDKSGQTDICFTSWIKNVEYITAGVDIIALTSKNEGTPVSLIEAQAAGKPIVSTVVGGIEDVVINGETALLSSPDDENGFIQNLLTLANDAEMRASFGGKGWSFVKTKFHYQRLVHDTAQLYNSLLP
jgi:glycosyltransferase involved in cell wall biosynthesis